ncbi:60 kDa inner membrane insertion protein [[Clostridium] ultunense Esp]|uniref:60 kDa inner membrane insertion protein n=1 Tax=[Clostridium] ultunense Esp TaxID=1288971 RepID=M1ZLB9_9FIRM|nr:YidC/Oxa1 family membrane protein insertase [Schnuerera ultunensis]CCQ96932.1 60 kDa inner membrane insertion protein [[Clostridium] ultunense Esp]SHD78042.1 60 kDa inner membrane insertion protein [[Clostridium] ultunense Esp]
MTSFLGNLLGGLLKFVFDMVSSIGTESELLSYYGIAIVLTTIIFKFILLPISLHQSRSTKKMNELQPKIKEIQNKYKNDPQTQNAKMMELYKEHNYNPASGCLILLIQFPIIIAFFNVLRDPIRFVFKDPNIYNAINKGFLWIPNLEQPDPYLWGLPLLAALTTFLQSRLMTSNIEANPQAESTQKMMNIFLPAMIFMAARSFAAGIGVYWVIGNIFQIIQQLISNRSLGKIKEETR